MIQVLKEKPFLKQLQNLSDLDVNRFNRYELWKNRDSSAPDVSKEEMERLSVLSEKLYKVSEKSQLEDFSVDDIIDALEFIPAQCQFEDTVRPCLQERIAPALVERLERVCSRRKRRRVF